jgi:N-acetylglutamate synthase-like GNAT family acetyltransferase
VASPKSSERAIRRARPNEAQLITDLALRSKASNGYSADFMAACVAELTMSADRIRDGEVWVAESGGEIAGYCEIKLEEGTAEVLGLFVEPSQKSSGVGRLLWQQLRDCAEEAGAKRIGVGSDPAAQGFYQRMGCTIIGTEPSGSIPGRVLPRFELTLASPL